MTLKEKAIKQAISPAIGLLNAFAPELNKIKPENPIAQFVHDNIQTLIIDGNNDDMSTFLSKVFIAQANENPEYVLSKLLCFYEAFRIFYGNYLVSIAQNIHENKN